MDLRARAVWDWLAYRAYDEVRSGRFEWVGVRVTGAAGQFFS